MEGNKGIVKNKVKIQSVKYNFMMNVILKMSSFIFPLITLPYITRTLGVIGNGKVAFTTSVISYFSMFGQLGIPIYGIRVCASCRDDKDKLTKTVQELLMINGIAVIFAYIALGLCVLAVPKLRQDSTLMLINSVTILLNMLGMDWLYQAVEQYQYITIRNITLKVISIILMFIFIHKPEDYVLYGVLAVLSAGGSNVLNLWNSRKFLVYKNYKGTYNFKQHIRPIWTFFALSIAVSIYTSMDTVMLGFLSNDEQVAYYVLATKIKMVLATTISALGPVLLPRITYCLNNGQEEKFKDYIEKSLHFVILSAIPVVLYFMIMSPETIQILGGDDYNPAIRCMQIITLTIIPLGVGNVACSQVLTPLRKEKLTMYSTIYGACINFVANAFLISHYGAVGAAAATVLAESIVAFIQARYAWNEMRDAFLKIPYMKFVIGNIVATIILYSVRRVFYFENALMAMVLTCIVFFGCYAIILLILKDELILKYGGHTFKLIKQKLTKNQAS